MSPLNPPLNKEDFINSGWKEVIDNSKRKECHSYQMAFWNKAKKAEEAGNIREQTIFGILAAVTGAAIKPESNDEFFNEVFSNLTEGQLNFLSDIALEISDPELQARVADILWVKKRDYQMGQLAVDAYLESAKELEHPEKWSYCVDRIERVLRLARKINYKYEPVFTYIEEVLDRYKGEDPLWLSAKLMELLLEYRFGDPKKYAAIAEKAATLAESNNDWRKARNHWEIKAGWHLIEKNGEQERTAQMRAAETYVKEAEDALKKREHPSYSVASHFMQKAVEAYRRVRGTKEETIAAKGKAEEVHKLLIQYQEESLKEFITVVSPEVDMSAGAEQARAHVRGREFQDALFALALLGTHPQVSHLKQQVQNMARDYVASHLFPSVMVNSMGKVIAHQSTSILSSDPNDVELATRFEMYNSAILYQTVYGDIFVGQARYQINLEHSVQVKDLLPIVLHSPFVPQGREYLFAKGLYAGLTGDFFTSTHILIPQIENSIRELLWRKQSVVTSKLNNKGIQDEDNLNTLLDPEKCPQITSIFDEDILFDLQGLLIRHEGSNLRNRMAHGLINDNEFNSPIMSYLWWVTLRLCCLPIWINQQKVENSNPFVQFDGIFKDDPLFDEFVEDMAANRRELDAEMAAYEASLEENQTA